MRELLRRFEVKKKAFSATTQEIKLDLPPPLDKLDVQGKINQGELTITRSVLADWPWNCS
jgi:hypothetical protein